MSRENWLIFKIKLQNLKNFSCTNQSLYQNKIQTFVFAKDASYDLISRVLKTSGHFLCLETDVHKELDDLLLAIFVSSSIRFKLAMSNLAHDITEVRDIRVLTDL